MATKTPEADYAQRSARVYERQLREQIERHGTPDLGPEAAGRRAALFTAAGQAWADEVGPFYDTHGARVALGGVSKQAVSQRVNAGRLLGLALASDGTSRDRWAYPVWQFRPGVLQHLPEVLRAAGYAADRPVTGWTIAAWLTTPDPRLGGMAPTRLLQAGHIGEVLALATEVAISLGVDERAAVRAAARSERR